MNTAKELAAKLLEFYGDDYFRWTKYDYALDDECLPCAPRSADALQWCALGALERLDLGCHALEQKLGTTISFFNDTCKDFDEFKSKLQEIVDEP